MILSYLIAGLGAFASGVGIFGDGVYQGTDFVISTWLGNDLSTLLIAIPALLISLRSSKQGSSKGLLVWIGMLDYMLYNYAFYLFGAAFNMLFFAYVILFALSLWALILALLSLDMANIGRAFSESTPVRRIATYLVFVAISLTTVYFLQWLSFMKTGQQLDIILMTGHPTNLVFALDLSLVVPVLGVGAVLLWQKRPWGFVLAAMANVKASFYMLTLSAATYTAFRAGTITSMSEVGLWISIGFGSALAVFFQLRHVKES